MLTLKLAVRNVFRHRWRTVISLAAISFGCLSLIFMGGFLEDVFSKMRDGYIYGHTGHFQIVRPAYHSKGERDPYDYLIDDYAAHQERLAHDSRVKRTAPRLTVRGLISYRGRSGPCIIQGVEPTIPSSKAKGAHLEKGDLTDRSGMLIVDGESFAPEDQRYSALVGKGLAEALGVSVGESLTVVVNSAHGSMNALDLTVQGIFHTARQPFDDRAIRIPIGTAQELVDSASIHALLVFLHETEQTATAIAEMEKQIRANQWDLEVKSWHSLSPYYIQVERFFNKMFAVIKFVVAIVVILSIYNTLNMAVRERVNEIGTIRALGSNRRRVVSLFSTEALILGLCGGGIGLILGAIVMGIVSSIGIPMPAPPGVEYTWFSQPEMTVRNAASAFSISLIATMAASILPSIGASRVDIMEALRQCN